MNLVRNERSKLLATYLNGLAIAALAIGGFSQLVAIGPGLLAAGIGSFFGWFSLSLCLHAIAQVTLGRLRE